MKSKKVIFLIFLVFTIVLTLSFILLACIHVYNKKSNSNNVIITEDYTELTIGEDVYVPIRENTECLRYFKQHSLNLEVIRKNVSVVETWLTNLFFGKDIVYTFDHQSLQGILCIETEYDGYNLTYYCTEEDLNDILIYLENISCLIN
ncbi:MAG: hypothetical protein E7660_04745 [Ruminococcaceae bacterium]|nr:hypothetical protein [Oscillospiraceae bacterium]